MAGTRAMTESTSISCHSAEGDTARKLKVLFVSHAYIVGINQGKLNAIAQLDNVEVGLIAPNNWTAREWNRLIPLENPYPNIHLYPVPVSSPGKGGACLYSPWPVLQALKDFQPDILQVELEVFSLGAFEFALWSRWTGIPISIFGWENRIERYLPLFRRLLSQFVLKTAPLIISGNQDGAALMRKWAYEGILEVMPQIGVDPDFFSPEKREAVLKHRSLEEKDRPFYIGYLGRLVEDKGVDLIFKAVCQLRSHGSNCQVIICGSGADEQILKQEAQTQGVADCVIWKGPIRHEEAPDTISTFDVLLLPSRTMPDWKEQFGHVLIEAMAMGVPVVGSDSGEIPNVIGREDLIFPEENYLALANLLKRLIDEPDWRKEVGSYGIDRVAHLYSHTQIASRLNSLWRTIITSDIM